MSDEEEAVLRKWLARIGNVEIDAVVERNWRWGDRDHQPIEDGAFQYVVESSGGFQGTSVEVFHVSIDDMIAHLRTLKP